MHSGLPQQSQNSAQWACNRQHLYNSPQSTRQYSYTVAAHSASCVCTTSALTGKNSQYMCVYVVKCQGSQWRCLAVGSQRTACTLCCTTRAEPLASDALSSRTLTQTHQSTLLCEATTGWCAGHSRTSAVSISCDRLLLSKPLLAGSQRLTYPQQPTPNPPPAGTKTSTAGLLAPAGAQHCGLNTTVACEAEPPPHSS